MSGIYFEGDRAMLQTALFNLFDNAAKYSDPAEAVYITLQHRSTAVHITVENALAAPSQIVAERLFEKYYRGGNTSGIGGTGVGLYLVRKIVEAHGGSVRAEVVPDRFSVAVSLPIERKVLES